MKVLFVSHLFPNSLGPNYGIWLYRLVRRCRSFGYDIRVINPDRVPGAFYRPDKWVRSFTELLGVFATRRRVFKDVPSLHPSHGESAGLPGSLTHVPRWLATERAYMRLRREGFAPDLVHCVTSYNSGSSVMRIVRSLGVPLVVTEISSPYSLETHPPHRRKIAETVLGRAAKVICISEFMKSEVSRAFPAVTPKIDVVYLPTADAFFGCHRAPKTADAIRLVTVCILSDQKGLSYMLEAVAILKRQALPVRWVLVGDGPSKRQLEHEAQRQGVGAEVQFLGQIANDSLPQILSRSHIYVLPSVHETQAVALVEGLAAGLPAVYTRCGGPEEFMSAEMGVAVPIRDAAAIARAVADVWSQYDHFREERLKEHARALFGEEECAKRMAAVYEAAVHS
jgi:glycosyltransferase involved in cell wall biosynthesis